MRWALKIRHPKSVVAMITAGLICVLIRPASADPEFMTQQIGWRVHYFEPVDINGDGIWELALQVGNNADSVGVYSPLLRKWIDGPHWLPVSGNNWGCGDFDQDGQVEYVYTVDSSVLICNPTMVTDSVFLLLTYQPAALQVWGRTENGQPTVILNYYISTDSSECYHDDNGPHCESEGRSWGRCYQYAITNGAHIDNWPGWRYKGRICFVDHHSSRPVLVSLRHEHDYWSGLSMGSSQRLVSVFYVLDVAGNCVNEVIIRNFAPCDWPDAWFGTWSPYIRLATVGRLKDKEAPATFGFIEAYSNCPSRIIDLLFCGNTTPSHTEVDWSTQTPPYYRGMVYYDLDGDQQGELILPLYDRSQPNQSIWHIRDPQTGALVDSIPGLPPADIRTAPIMESDFLDLYYFLDSTLHILDRPSMPTGILTDNGDPSPPTEFQLRQNFPNPFNASTIIEFELDRPGVTKLAIYNILGKKVIVLLNEHRAAGPQRVTWDGADRDGHPVVSGIYFYRITTSSRTQTRKMVLLK